MVLIDNRDEVERATSSLQLNGVALEVILKLLNGNPKDQDVAPRVRLSDLLNVLGAADPSKGVTISDIDLLKPGGGSWMGATCVPPTPGHPPQLRLGVLTNCYQCPSHVLPYDVLREASQISDGRLVFKPHESRGQVVGRYLEEGSLPPVVYNVGADDPARVAAANPSPTLYDGYSFVYGDVLAGGLRFTTNRLMVRPDPSELSSPSWRAAFEASHDGVLSQDFRAQPSIALPANSEGRDYTVDVLANTALNNMDHEPKSRELHQSVSAVVERIRGMKGLLESPSFVHSTLIPALVEPLCSKQNHAVAPESKARLFIKSRWTGLAPERFEELVAEVAGGSVEEAAPIVALERKIQRITLLEQEELHKNVYTDITAVHPSTKEPVSFKTRMQTVVVVERLPDQSTRLHYSYRRSNGPSDHEPWEAITIDFEDAVGRE